MRPTGGNEFIAIAGHQTGAFTAIDLVLLAPCLDRLRTDPELTGNLCDWSTGTGEVQRATTELRWVTLRHAEPSFEVTGMQSNNTTPEKWGNIRASTNPGAVQLWTDAPSP